MLPWKIFENLHTVMVVLVLFEQFSGKVSLYFWPLTLSAYQIRCTLFAQFRLCVLETTKAYCNEEVQNYGKIVFI